MWSFFHVSYIVFSLVVVFHKIQKRQLLFDSMLFCSLSKVSLKQLNAHTIIHLLLNSVEKCFIFGRIMLNGESLHDLFRLAMFSFSFSSYEISTCVAYKIFYSSKTENQHSASFEIVVKLNRFRFHHVRYFSDTERTHTTQTAGKLIVLFVPFVNWIFDATILLNVNNKAHIVSIKAHIRIR